MGKVGRGPHTTDHTTVKFIIVFPQLFRVMPNSHCGDVNGRGTVTAIFAVFRSILSTSFDSKRGYNSVLKSLFGKFTPTQTSPAKLRGRHDMKFSKDNKPRFMFGDFLS